MCLRRNIAAQTSLLGELSVFMLGTGEDEVFRQMEKFTHPFHNIQYYIKPHFDMLAKFHSQKILFFPSFNFDLKLESTKNSIWI